MITKEEFNSIEVGDKVQLMDGNVYSIMNKYNDRGIYRYLLSSIFVRVSYETINITAVIKKDSEPHPHKDAMMAAAHGAEIEYRGYEWLKWESASTPTFRPNALYRVKPIKTKEQLETEIEIENTQATIEELQQKLKELETRGFIG